MRLVLSVGILLPALAGVDAAKAQTELRASVDVSEWAPSQNLALNLETGSYVVTPPLKGWPEAMPQPVQRRGRLSGEDLRMVRRLAERAFEAVLTDKQCEARKATGVETLLGARVGPEELSLTDGRTARTSSRTRCRTKSANALFMALGRLFDRSSWSN